MIDYKHKDLFWDSSIEKQIIISCGNVTLTNEDLYNQEMALEESLCSEQELRFGCCEASVLKFKISDIFSPMAGKWLDVKMIVNGDQGNPLSIGKYKVNSDKVAADRKHREIVAYDAMYEIINASAIDWYNMVFPNKDSKITMRQLRASFAKYFGLQEQEITLANDGMIVEKTIQVGEDVDIDNEEEQVSILKDSALSGKDVITAICEINGCFGHIGRDGKLHYIYLQPNIQGLYPANDLFPDHSPEYLPQARTEHLYPQDPKSNRFGKDKYIKCDYEKDLITKRINRLQIRQEENDIGAVWPEGKANPEDNCYIIQDNFLVYGKSAEELQVIARNVYEKIKEVVYQPFSCDAIGNPCLEVGDPARFLTTYDIVESYILKRTLKGIQALRDNLGADGVEKYGEKVNGIQSSILQLKGKTNTLERNVEETRSTLGDVEGNLQTQISQTVEKITLEATEREKGEKELSSRIEQTIKSISLQINNGDKTAGIIISMENEKGETIKGMVTGKIDMTGLVSFNNLENSGETIIDGGNIKAESIDVSKINVRTLYVEDELRIRHTQSDGTSTMRTALLMEDVKGQTFPNLILGGNGKFANCNIANDLHCSGANGIDTTKLFVTGESQFGKMITMEGADIYFDSPGKSRGVKTYDKNGVYNAIAALSSDDVTTLIGCKANSGHSTVTVLRGNSVHLGSSSGAVVTSDERLKNSFKPLDEFEEIYMDIEPCAFKYNNGTSGRYHFGAKAGDVKKAFEVHGYTAQDFGGFVQMVDNPENEDYCGIKDPMGLIYTEFTMWNMHMVQKVLRILNEQQEEINALKEKISSLSEGGEKGE